MSQKTYYRLPATIIGNELYRLEKAVSAIYSSQAKGNDLNIESWEQMQQLVWDIDDAIETHSIQEKGK